MKDFSDDIKVERFSADGSLISSKAIERELPTFGAFLDSGEAFYLAFGQDNLEEDDNREVWRIVKYDRDWNRLGAVSVTGGESYTIRPFDYTVARMAMSEDGKTVTLHAARQRYLTSDGLRHQSNITISIDPKAMTLRSVSGKFPDNHVSHSFGQFVRYDGSKMVTVDHGDAYPRSFVLQDGTHMIDLLELYGATGDNFTSAIGSGLEISDSGYLFLGCSNPQDGSTSAWNLFLTYTDKESGETKFNWLTHKTVQRWEDSVNTARLVKVDEDTFVAMWAENVLGVSDGTNSDLHWQRLDGRGNPVGEEQVKKDVPMPPTDPVVIDGDICWIQYSESQSGPYLYRLKV